MLAADRAGGAEIGDGAGDAQDAVKAARRPAEARRHALQELRCGSIETAMLVERAAGERAVGDALAIERALARDRDALRDDRARLAVGAAGELCGGDGGHLDLQVDAIEQRAADPALVAKHGVGVQRHASAALPSWPQGHGFIAATSWNAAGNSA